MTRSYTDLVVSSTRPCLVKIVRLGGKFNQLNAYTYRREGVFCSFINWHSLIVDVEFWFAGASGAYQ